MRLSYSFAAVLGCFLAACAASPGDGTDSSAGAATASTKVTLQSGHYDDVDLVVSGSKVSGAYFSQVGDPAHGGATCSFTFAGTVTTVNNVDHATIVAVDGWDTTGGTLDATLTAGKPGVTVRTNDLLNACMRSSPTLQDAAGDPNGDFKKMEAGVTGYGTVGATKAFFYDHAGGTPRTAYVVQGDTIVTTGAAANGFVAAKYVGTTTTSGFLRTQDLDTPAPAPASPLAGKFELQNGAGIESGFEVISVTDSQISFNLSAVMTTGSHHIGEIDAATAPLANDVATYTDSPTADGCTIAFKFDPTGASADVTQTGACGDFGAFVDVTGHYTKQ